MNNYRRRDGAVIDRTRALPFTFDGRRYIGYAGDTLASALLANGVRIVGRSFKLHRPRGVLSAGLEEPNALVTVGEGPSRTVNLRATEVPLDAGLVAQSQNCWPDVRFDVAAILQAFSCLLPAGFYHKTFRWPSWSWYEPTVRHLAGLGRLGYESDPERYAKLHAHCELLIVGGGPAGLAVAREAAERGEDVVLIERDAVWGGSAVDSTGDIQGRPARRWVSDCIAELAAAPNVRLLLKTLAFAHYEGNLVAAVEHIERSPVRQRLWRIRAERVVLATGAIERPLVFENNDRPGILLASAAATYARRYAVCPGSRAVVFTNNDSAYEAAFALREQDVEIVALIDVRRSPGPTVLEQARAHRFPVLLGGVVVDTHGWRTLRAISVADYDAEFAQLHPGTLRRLKCDLLCVSGGWDPVLHLYSQAGGKLSWDPAKACFVPSHCPQRVECVGAAAGALDTVQAIWRVPCASGRDRRHKQWVDLAHDVTVADIDLAVTEGFGCVEHLKRYTTVGMAVDQGKTSNVNALALLGAATERAPGEIGTTTFRPPFHPITSGALAGGQVDDLAQRFRQLPVESHETAGAVMEDHSGWLRPAYYLRAGETEEEAIDRELRAARRGVVLFDSSSLGKIEVLGPDAAEFLNRLYVNNVKSLPPGYLRYGLMLNDNGIIVDDGVFACMAEGHYLVNTSSAGALNVYHWMEEWRQCEWRNLRVWIAQQTAQWATLTVSGPNARAVLSGLQLDLDLGAAAFPHMRINTTGFEGFEVRVRRASFTGELSFELDVPAECAGALWERLLELGRTFDIMPLGMEALDRLRIEKGFLEVGVDTDGETSPLDVGWAAAVARKTEDFIGRRSLARTAFRAPGRLQLVGLISADPGLHIPVGTHAIAPGDQVEGHVTSSCVSPHVGRSVALAMIRSGATRKGERVTLDLDGRRYPAAIVDTAFFDPRGERLRV